MGFKILILLSEIINFNQSVLKLFLYQIDFLANLDLVSNIILKYVKLTRLFFSI
jgi:hypothetical protein